MTTVNENNELIESDEPMEEVFYKKDVVMMYIIYFELIKKGFKKEELMTNEEEDRFLKVIKNNNIDTFFEDFILTELFNQLLVKSGVRFGVTAEFVN
jgi:hypothetical protein